jgi:hypothetical protein
MTSHNDRLGDISRETFHAMDTDGKLGALFDVLSVRLKKADCRIDRLEKRKRIDTGIAGVMGIIGGFAAELVGKLR